MTSLSNEGRFHSQMAFFSGDKFFQLTLLILRRIHLARGDLSDLYSFTFRLSICLLVCLSVCLVARLSERFVKPLCLSVCLFITPVRILLSQNQTTVKSKRRYLASCRFFHQFELEKIFILLMNFVWIASNKII